MYLPGVVEIIQRGSGWVIREVDRCAHGRREKRLTKIMTNKPTWIPKGRTRNGRCKAGKCTRWLTPSRQTEHPGQTCPNSKGKQLDTGAKQEAQREGAESGEERAGEGAHRGDVPDGFISDTTRGPVGPHNGDDDTRERKGRENVTETREKRYLKKGTRALATALDAAENL